MRAVQSHLRLDFRADRHGEIEFLVIDAIQKPSEN
jgi:hypothetical protein